jgi:RNA polymerase sigma-70 factor (ECF subfamily)
VTTLLAGGGPRGTETLDDDVDLARDRALVTRAQSGDRSAFDDLYMRYYRRLYRFCLRRLRDSHEAEDVAQEAFARAWRALPTFGGDRRFYPWLSVIASHLCTDVLRRRNRSTPVAEFHQSNLASTDDGGEELMLAAVDSALVAKAFTRLSDRHQRILHLREGSGWSYQRIADHEGVGITAVETLLWRARQALKREFASLAGAQGRMGAWLGGLVSMTSVRRLLQLPRRALHKAASTGAKGMAVAAGSAVAATAMVIGATLSSPVPTTVTTSRGSAAVVDDGLAPLVPTTELPLLVPSGSASGTGGGTGAGLGGAGGAVPGSPGGTSSASAPPGGGGGSSPIDQVLHNPGGTLGALGSTVDSTTGGVLTTLGATVQQVSGATSSLLGNSLLGGSLLGSPAGTTGTALGTTGTALGTTLNSAGASQSSGSGIVGTTLTTVGNAVGSVTNSLLGGG